MCDFLRQEPHPVLPRQTGGGNPGVQLVAMFVRIRIGKNIVRHNGYVLGCLPIVAIAPVVGRTTD